MAVRKQSKGGRPPSGPDGEPVSKYPRLNIVMEPRIRDLLAAACTLTRKPAWKILADALEGYVKGMPAQDRASIDSMVNRMASKKVDSD